MADDVIDSEHKSEMEKKNFIKYSREFFHRVFSNREVTGYFRWQELEPREAVIDWVYFAKHFDHVQMGVLRGISRIAHYLPQEPFFQLLKALERDICFDIIKDEEDFVEHASGSACFNIPMIWISCHRSCWKNESNVGIDEIVKKSYCTSIVSLIDSVIENTRKMHSQKYLLSDYTVHQSCTRYCRRQ